MNEAAEIVLEREVAIPFRTVVDTATGNAGFCAYGVRFKGHLCASVKSGLCRKPILLRARKGDAVFRSLARDWDDNEERPVPEQEARKLARLECARAIKRTEAARRRLQGDHMLRGIETVERLLRDRAMTRRGKRWKIVEIK